MHRQDPADPSCMLLDISPHAQKIHVKFWMDRPLLASAAPYLNVSTFKPNRFWSEGNPSMTQKSEKLSFCLDGILLHDRIKTGSCVKKERAKKNAVYIPADPNIVQYWWLYPIK